jgi:hypothetical protein
MSSVSEGISVTVGNGFSCISPICFFIRHNCLQRKRRIKNKIKYFI